MGYPNPLNLNPKVHFFQMELLILLTDFFKDLLTPYLHRIYYHLG